MLRSLLFLFVAGAALLAGGARGDQSRQEAPTRAPSLPPAAYCRAGEAPRFADGFAALRTSLAALDVMGQPTECPHADPFTGDILQQATGGLAYYRPATNTPSFTDGQRRWALGPEGLVFWSGEEVDPPPPVAPSFAQQRVAIPAAASTIPRPLSSLRAYLYQRWPSAARRMDCVILHESAWNPRARNASSDATGLAQFIPSTWARTPQGRAGRAAEDPIANIDAFGWMIVQGGGSWTEWEVVLVGLC